MKKYIVGFVLLFIAGTSVVQAATAEIKKVVTLGTNSVTIKYVNVRAAQQFKFQLYDRRTGRTNWRKVDTFYIRRTSKTRTHKKSTISGLKTAREYRLRYKPIYIGDREGIWSDYLSFTTREHGVYITLNDNGSLLDDDIPFIYVDADSDTTAEPGAYVMEEQSDGSWLGIIPDVTKDDVIQYVIARNYAGPRSFEQFDPDDVSTRRTITADEIPFEKSLTIDNWRWLRSDITDGTINTDNYSVVARDPFVLGAALDNRYLDTASTFSATTFTSIADLGLSYVVLPYASRMITNGSSVTTTETVDAYPTDNEYAKLVTAAEAAGLTAIMKIDFPIDPDNTDNILDALDNSTEREFFGTYLTRWREAMNDGVDYAIEHNIDIVVLDTSFYDTLDLAGYEEQYYLNTLLRDDILPIVAADYTGVLTTAELSADPDFNWYSSSDIDWLGASWYPGSNPASELTSTYQVLSAAYSNKPVFFYNLGVYGIDGASSLGASIAPSDARVNPDYADTTYALDYQEQADHYETVFRAIADNSFVIGAMAPEYSYGVQYDKSANIRAKTARLVWQRWSGLF